MIYNIIKKEIEYYTDKQRLEKDDYKKNAYEHILIELNYLKKMIEIDRGK